MLKVQSTIKLSLIRTNSVRNLAVLLVPTTEFILDKQSVLRNRTGLFLEPKYFLEEIF